MKKMNGKKQLIFLFAQSDLCMLNYTQKSKRNVKKRATLILGTKKSNQNYVLP